MINQQANKTNKSKGITEIENFKEFFFYLRGKGLTANDIKFEIQRIGMSFFSKRKEPIKTYKIFESLAMSKDFGEFQTNLSIFVTEFFLNSNKYYIFPSTFYNILSKFKTLQCNSYFTWHPLQQYCNAKFLFRLSPRLLDFSRFFYYTGFIINNQKEIIEEINTNIAKKKRKNDAKIAEFVVDLRSILINCPEVNVEDFLKEISLKDLYSYTKQEKVKENIRSCYPGCIEELNENSNSSSETESKEEEKEEKDKKDKKDKKKAMFDHFWFFFRRFINRETTLLTLSDLFKDNTNYLKFLVRLLKEKKYLKQVEKIENGTYDEEDEAAFEIEYKIKKKDYINLPEDVQVKMISDCSQESLNFLDIFKDEDNFGIDSEWKPEFPDENSDSESDIIQIACKKAVLIVDCKEFIQSQELINKFYEVFSGKTFLGFSFKSDTDKMNEVFKEFFSKSKIVDLSELYKDEFGEKCPGLSKVCEKLLGKKLDKRWQMSNWKIRPLRKSQITYSALDAFILITLYEKITNRIGLKDVICLCSIF